MKAKRVWKSLIRRGWILLLKNNTTPDNDNAWRSCAPHFPNLSCTVHYVPVVQRGRRWVVITHDNIHKSHLLYFWLWNPLICFINNLDKASTQKCGSYQHPSYSSCVTEKLTWFSILQVLGIILRVMSFMDIMTLVQVFHFVCESFWPIKHYLIL